MATYKIVYKNHCTPQEQVSSSGRYYLDSDCGRKLTGLEAVTSLSSLTYEDELEVTDTISGSLTSSQDFFYIKNTGSNDVLIALNGTNFKTKIVAGDSFASEISTSATVKVKCNDGETSTVEYLRGA